MFESINHDEQQGAIKYLTSLTLSLTIHAVIVTTAIVLPLIFFRAVQTNGVFAILIDPHNIKGVSDPPAPQSKPSAPADTPIVVKTNGVFNPPKEIPNWKINPPDFQAEGSNTDYRIGMPNDLGKGFGTQIPSGNTLDEIVRNNINQIPPPPPPSKPKPRETIRIGIVDPAMLVRQVAPVYPPLAVKTGVSGTVTLEAIIDEEGNVKVMKVIDGHILLRDAAITAVNQWKYTPTVQNGEPIQVVAIFKVNFKFSNRT
jgi:periplasmic protein TonB